MSIKKELKKNWNDFCHLIFIDLFPINLFMILAAMVLPMMVRSCIADVETLLEAQKQQSHEVQD